MNRDLPADVDAILHKPLRLEPEERYVSVDVLAADIRAFLESRPVQARSGDAWYRGSQVHAEALDPGGRSAGLPSGNAFHSVYTHKAQILGEDRAVSLGRNAEAIAVWERVSSDFKSGRGKIPRYRVARYVRAPAKHTLRRVSASGSPLGRRSTWLARYHHQPSPCNRTSALIER